MFFRILKKELRRKRTMNLILCLFVTAATMFLASSVSNLRAVLGAVDSFMERSKVPDYFAIALADESGDAIEDYLAKSGDVAEYETVHTFIVNDGQIAVLEAGDEAAGSYQRTNTLVVQAVPENFMKVFDCQGNPLQLKSGEIAFPRVEAEENHLAVGDRVSIRVGALTQEFTIAAITKDVVFGNSFMDIKRLVIAKEDYERFAAQENLTYGNIYCVDYADGEAFQRDWKKQNISLNIGIEKSMIPMCYMIELILAGVLLVVSVCLILISFLVLRFTIVFTMQEDYREIGIMKAIGMREAGIWRVYMVKYVGLSVAGAFAGLALSVPFGELLLRQALVNLVAERTDGGYLLRLASAALIVVTVLLFCYACTGRLRRFSAITAIRNGSTGERYQAKNVLRLCRRKRMNTCLYLACNDILSAPRRFAVLMLTFCICTLLVLLPLSALSTLESDEAYELLTELFADYKVMDMQECTASMIGDVIDQMRLLIFALTVIVLVINSLFAVLLMKLMMERERGQIAQLKSVGFRDSAPVGWQTARILIVLAAAILLGCLLSRLFAPVTVGLVFHVMGATQIKLTVNALASYVCVPLLLLAVTGFFACLCAGSSSARAFAEASSTSRGLFLRMSRPGRSTSKIQERSCGS